MARKAEFINASNLIRDLIESELKKRTISSQYQKRLKVVSMSLSGIENKSISVAVGYDVKTVRRWRSRWGTHTEELSVLEKDFSEKRGFKKILLDKIKDILSDNPRPGSPQRITGAERLRIQTLACESPKDYELPFTNWTHQSLSDICKSIGIEVSRSQVGVILKKRFTAP